MQHECLLVVVELVLVVYVIGRASVGDWVVVAGVGWQAVWHIDRCRTHLDTRIGSHRWSVQSCHSRYLRGEVGRIDST